MNQTIQGNNVIESTTTPLPEYIASVQMQIATLQRQIETRDRQSVSDATKIANLVARLSALVPA